MAGRNNVKPGTTIRLKMVFFDALDNPVDLAVLPKIRITDPNEQVAVVDTPVTKDTPTGAYFYDFAAPADADFGYWVDRWIIDIAETVSISNTEADPVAVYEVSPSVNIKSRPVIECTFIVVPYTEDEIAATAAKQDWGADGISVTHNEAARMADQRARILKKKGGFPVSIRVIRG